MKRWGIFFSLFMVTALLVAAFPVGSVAADGTRPATGLTALTPAEEEWARQNVPVIQRIRLNDIALQRINTERQSKGLTPLSEAEMEIAPQGNEAILASAPGNVVEQVPGTIGAPLGVLPSEADNSLSPAFPPVGDQGGLGTCAAWSSTYYLLTYETNLALGRVASTGDSSVVFSPKWTYNMVNGGRDGGANFIEAFALMNKNGAVSWSEFPYDTDYLQWPMNPASWDRAMNYRTESYGEITGDTPEQLINNLKTQLANGHLAVFATYVYSWNQRTVGNDSATNLDDPFIGQTIATYASNTNDGGHGMTVVGYNDNIWADLNSNGIVDSGEKGAFKVVNSWGIRDWNRGFRWVSYDALRVTSAVPASSYWPTRDRSSLTVFWPRQIYTLTVKGDYAPTLKAEVVLNHSSRGQLAITLGVGETTATSPAYAMTWQSKAVYYTGGGYAFNGGGVAVDGTFFFDFTDLASKVTGNKRWFVGVTDSTPGAPATIKSFRLYQDDAVVAAAMGLPRSVDSNTIYAWVDYDATNSNRRPAASFTATPMSGITPLTVSFDGSASSDADGTITDYAWDFGDGGTGTGATAEHTYITAGSFSATLTVKDNSGATGSKTALISVSPPVNHPPQLEVIGSKATTAGQPLSFTISAADPDNDTLSFFASGLPYGASFNSLSQTFSWMPDTSQVGTYSNIRFQVMDARGASDSETISITVNAPAVYGQISGIVKDAATGAAIQGATVSTGFRYASTGADGSFTLTSVQPGGYNLTAQAQGYQSVSQSVSVKAGVVSTVNLSLAKTAPAKTMWVDSITFAPGAQDMYVKVKVLNPSPMPNVYLRLTVRYAGVDRYYYGATGATGEASIRIYPAADGIYVASVGYLSYTGYLWDATKGVTSASYTLSRQTTNVPPVASFTATPTSGGVPLAVVFNASASRDPDGSIASYAWAFGDGSTGSGVTASHTYSTAGGYTVTLTVTDNKGATNSSTTVISVLAPANHAPVLAPIGNKTAIVRQYLSINLSSSDADRDRLVYSASNLPSGAGFYAPMGIFYWMPSAGQVGTYPNVRFQVADGKGGIDYEDITITVTGTVTGGTISGVVKDNAGALLAGVTVSDGVRSAVTGSNGAYTIAGVPAGTYSVTAVLTGYTGNSQPVTVVAGQTATANFILQKPVSGYMWVESITFLPGPTDLTVKIKIAGPQPVSGANVITSIAHAGVYNYYSARTDANGEATFTIAQAGDGSYTATVILISHPTLKWDTTKGTRVATSSISR